MKNIFSLRFYFFCSILAILQIGGGNLYAQKADNYAFVTATNSTLIEMSGSTTLFTAGASTQNSAVLPLGFDVWFMGVRFTTFSVAVNGAMQLGTNPIAPTANHYNIPNAPRIVPFASGQVPDGNFVVSPTGKVHYKTIGTAPNRIIVVEWLNIGVGINSKAADATFQLLLYETAPRPMTTQGGRIEFRYAQMELSAYNTLIAVSVGIGLGANFKAVQHDLQPPVATLIDYRGTINNGFLTTLHSTTPTTRRIFSFESPAPDGNVFNVKASTSASNQIVLNWEENANNEVGYVIYKSLDGKNFSFLTQVNGSLTYTDTDVKPCKPYFYRVYTVTEGKLGVLQTTADIRYEITQSGALDITANTLFACPTNPATSSEIKVKSPANTKFIDFFWLNSQNDTLNKGETFVPAQIGNYTVVGIQEDSCTSSKSFTITECCPLDVAMPTAFTPFNTPANNLYKVRCINCGNFSMKIYNRWGMLVFESNDPETGWNGGLFNGNQLQGDAYQVVISYTGCENGETVSKTRREVVYLLE